MGVIEIKDLVKKYGENTAVDHLSLNIEKGRVYGFLGPNGAGKSTTMNIITGYIGPGKSRDSIFLRNRKKQKNVSDIYRKCHRYIRK